MKHDRPNNGHQRLDRKALQLCSQVRYALEYAINSVMQGEYGLTVLEVVPAPNTSHLLVLVQSLEELSFDKTMRLEAELNSHVNALRAAVSESIHRRKTPGLFPSNCAWLAKALLKRNVTRCQARMVLSPVNELVGKSRCEHVCRGGAKLLPKPSIAKLWSYKGFS